MGNSASTHEPLSKKGGFTRGTFGDTKNTTTNSETFRQSKRSPKRMDRLRKSFRDSFRRRKDRVPESAKPHQWQSDESAVRNGTCSFPVKYLGCVEVFESRGMQVCEEALKVLRNSKRRPVRGILHVSGDGLRVVDDETKGLIVDQTIEKVSFCAPDRNHERGFSYICRDGTTRRWMCHGFLANKDSGERLSHAVGCAFAVCLERKQRRDKECGVTMTFDMKNSTFTRTGSFRTQTLTERLMNSERGVDVVTGVPQATVAPQPKPFNPFAIARPHATPSMLERQGSFRGFDQLGANSPFKRQMSLRVNDLPSNAERQRVFRGDNSRENNQRSVSPIPEISALPSETVAQLCQELSQNLTMLTKNDIDDFNFNNQSSINQNTGLDYNMSGSTKAVAIYNPGRNFINNTEMSVMGSSISGSISTNGTPTAQISPQRRETVTPPSPLNPPTPPQKIVPIEAVSPLPNPDQWLGQIVNKTTSPSPRRPPTLGVTSRTKSLNDPFDAEWAERVSASTQVETTRNTNPFISPPKPPAQSFQVQL